MLSVFVQWIERGIFVITPEFAATAIQNLNSHSPYDQKFKYYLMSVLPETDALEILRQCSTDDRYAHSAAPSRLLCSFESLT